MMLAYLYKQSHTEFEKENTEYKNIVNKFNDLLPQTNFSLFTKSNDLTVQSSDMS